MKYEVLFPIWHTKDLRTYGKGAEVDLGHLSDKKIAQLEKDGIVKPVATAAVSKKIGETKKGE